MQQNLPYINFSDMLGSRPRFFLRRLDTIFGCHYVSPICFCVGPSRIFGKLFAIILIGHAVTIPHSHALHKEKKIKTEYCDLNQNVVKEVGDVIHYLAVPFGLGYWAPTIDCFIFPKPSVLFNVMAFFEAFYIF